MKKSLIYFLKTYAKIVEPATVMGNKGGAIPFEFWPHLVEITWHFLHSRFIVILKPRQAGVSWILAAYALWMAITKDSANILMFSKGEKECWELLAKCRRIWEQLPPFMKFPLKKDSAEELEFRGLGSHIKAFAATESAGVGEAASVIIADEWEYHPFAASNFLNARPTIDSSGGQWIGCFTVDKRKPNTYAKKIFKQAHYDKVGDFVPLFYPYNVRPGRDEEWYEKTKLNTPDDELDGLTPDLYMQQNYPRSIEEALSPVQEISAFDLNILDRMMDETRRPLDLNGKYPDLNPMICRIYKDYVPGRTYVAASDTAHGVGKDYHATGIMDVRTKEIVADIFTNRLQINDFAYWSVKLLEVFGKPKWGPEDNEWGKSLIDHAISMGYRNWIYYDDKRTKIGIHVNDPIRKLIWGKLLSAINNNQLVVYNAEGLKQFYDIIWYVDPTGKRESRLEAMAGRHDDYPTMAGEALYLAEKVPLNNAPQVKSIETLTFV